MSLVSAHSLQVSHQRNPLKVVMLRVPPLVAVVCQAQTLPVNLVAVANPVSAVNQV